MEWRQRRAMVDIGAAMHARGLVAATDGNLSVRLGPGRFLITPSGTSLGHLAPVDPVVIDAAGQLVGGRIKPSSEYRLHLAVYAARPDVAAIVHAHPPVANGFSFAGQTLDATAVPEVVATIGKIPTTPYATPSTQEGADVIRPFIAEHDAVLLQRHGSITVGADLPAAYRKLEKLEHTAQVLWVAKTLGRVVQMSEDEIHSLAQMREAHGLGPAADVFRACGVPPPD